MNRSQVAVANLKKPFVPPLLLGIKTNTAVSYSNNPQRRAATPQINSQNKGKGKARDSGIGGLDTEEQLAGDEDDEHKDVMIQDARIVWSIQYRAAQARKNKSWESYVALSSSWSSPDTITIFY